MRCPSCGAGNSENDKFCAFCGQNLSEAIEPEPTDKTDAELTPEGVSTFDEPVISTNTAEVETKKKRRKAPLIILIVLLISGLLAGGVYAYTKLMPKALTPEELLTEAYFSMLEAESGEIVSTVSFDDIDVEIYEADIEMIVAILEDIEFGSKMRFDINTRQIEGKIELEMMGADFLSMAYYLDTEVMMIDVPFIYDQAFYMTLEDLVNLLQGPMIDNLMYGSNGFSDTPIITEETPKLDYKEIENAMDIVISIFEKDQYTSYDNIDQTMYKALITSYYKEVITKIDVHEDGIEYVMPYNGKEANYLAEDTLELLLDDPDFIVFIEEVINVFYDKVVAEKNILLYALLTDEDPMSIDAWEGALFEAELEIKRQEILKNLEEELKDLDGELIANLYAPANMYQSDLGIGDVNQYANIDVVMELDEENRFDAQTTTIDMDLTELIGEDASLMITVDNNFEGIGQPVEFDGIDYKASLDLGALDEDGLMSLFMEIQNNVLENVEDNPMLNNLLEMGF